ncbi:hypothetical protein ACMD2_04460 [Ananas comosus]|uniref:Uncharacterized protein n=1 Tax=Ananas comosus TaxID=4615 RepID=A0A199VPA6_ANACO|nr:hypothetical protein ACMD2_04460 [Ananas comosus]
MRTMEALKSSKKSSGSIADIIGASGRERLVGLQEPVGGDQVDVVLVIECGGRREVELAQSCCSDCRKSRSPMEASELPTRPLRRELKEEQRALPMARRSPLASSPRSSVASSSLSSPNSGLSSSSSAQEPPRRQMPSRAAPATLWPRGPYEREVHAEISRHRLETVKERIGKRVSSITGESDHVLGGEAEGGHVGRRGRDVRVRCLAVRTSAVLPPYLHLPRGPSRLFHRNVGTRNSLRASQLELGLNRIDHFESPEGVQVGREAAMRGSFAMASSTPAKMISSA